MKVITKCQLVVVLELHTGTPYRKSDIETLEKVQKKATKILPKISHLKYSDRLKACKLPMLHKYRWIRGDMIRNLLYTIW